MKLLLSRAVPFLCALLVIALSVQWAEAQDRRPTGGEVLGIRKFTGLGRQAYVQTPEYQTSVGRLPKTNRQWGRLMVEYTTFPEWLDDLEFRYHAMALTAEEGRKAYSLYRATVRYADVQATRGRQHLSEVFLRPAAILRYGELIAIAVEVYHDGELVAEASEVSAKDKDLKPREKTWWKDTAVTESQSVTVREGYLVSRKDSPFAYVNIDAYEVIR